uniref:Uncharacterized protein n=1 Tax=Anguilla anguilla TaxID=7936 RepID=A0A0E9XNF3_ANGAN
MVTPAVCKNSGGPGPGFTGNNTRDHGRFYFVSLCHFCDDIFILVHPGQITLCQLVGCLHSLHTQAVLFSGFL